MCTSYHSTQSRSQNLRRQAEAVMDVVECRSQNETAPRRTNKLDAEINEGSLSSGSVRKRHKAVGDLMQCRTKPGHCQSDAPDYLREGKREEKGKRAVEMDDGFAHRDGRKHRPPDTLCASVRQATTATGVQVARPNVFAQNAPRLMLGALQTRYAIPAVDP
ncbi:hypothetical protein NPX13_g11113 [Xylaria arbuscula]|uniref:Uncharacterized protein n=1 Tax=Xylaria arbuscula TaxID=114810 RepID=A0A9W8N3A2_9PEZI|nr:hypothetical protein NPX13_g11113 [Xylaria arbuscula]